MMLLFAACSPKSTLELALDDLSARFVAANQADTIDPMLKLYCLNGCDSLIISRLKGALDYELGLPIQQIEFEALSGAAEETIEFHPQRRQLRPQPYAALPDAGALCSRRPFQ